MKLKIQIALLALLGFTFPAFSEFVFVHPGLLHSAGDLERMKRAVAAKEEPVFSGFEVFRKDSHSQSNYVLRGPLESVARGRPTVGAREYDSDADAAYQCALMWVITGKRPYAEKAERIIDAWSAKLKSVNGADAVLMAGLGPFKMVNAAEILRYTDAGWSPGEIQRTEKHFREVIYPVIQNFAPFANGNWDTACIKTMMAIGVFCNDRAMFEKALRYYVDGAGDGSLTHYIINDTGQCQESGRDQQHTQLGLAHMGDCCEIAWHQGLNLYGYDDHRLLKSFEYTAKYNLGHEVPFKAATDQTGKYRHTLISSNGRGRFRAIFEEIYNAYANRLGIPAPWTEQVIGKIRPEGVGVPTAPSGADHPGFGTLLFAQPASRENSIQSQTAPAAPGGVIANGSKKEIKMTWIESIGATHYSIERSTDGETYKLIATNLVAAAFTDTNVHPGTTYHYRVFAANAVGKSAASFPVSICAGLPEKWTQEDIGAVSVAGNVNFDGNTFTLKGSGGGFDGKLDQFQFGFRPFDGDGTIVARFVPQTSSQYSESGLMLRASTAADAVGIGLLILPTIADDLEAPSWRAELIVRNSAKAAAKVCAVSRDFSEPMVTFGRLTGYCWLKLKRAGASFTASFSSDGKNWNEIGTVTVPVQSQIFAGLMASSRIPEIRTTVRFDNVKIIDDVQ
ncbi:MAG TPA: alginate lyase family protein [Verrucomicrobiae bacterium]|nr:alginate lyase family protein [Verrucomicrobiae bacterium]